MAEINDGGWPFDDPKNVAVFTDKSVIDGTAWVADVYHDEDDGAWQFHPKGGTANEENARIVGLETMACLHPSILGLADLPLGWRAWREHPTAPWQRAPQTTS